MTNTVKYYADRNSNVHICALDLCKAFDEVEHSLLFEKLMKRNCPRKSINILMNWYSQSTTIVKWGSKYSSPVSLTSGVRQGSILVSVLFSIFADDLLLKLEGSNLGFHIKYIPFNALMYAIDMILVSSSINDLQKIVIFLTLCYRV